MNEFDQTPFGDDVAFARLQAADPAAQATPDLARIRSRVTARIEATPADELSKRRGSKRWFLGAAAVAAGAVLIGSGGFALGTVASDSSTAGSALAGKVATSAKGTALNATDQSVSPTPVVPEMSATGTYAFRAMANSALSGTRTPINTSNVRFAAATALTASATSAVAYAFDSSGLDVANAAMLLSHRLGLNVIPDYNKAAGMYVASARGATLQVAVNPAIAFDYGRRNGLLSAPSQSCPDGPGGGIPVQSGLAGAGFTNRQMWGEICGRTPLSSADSSPAISAAKAAMRAVWGNPTHFVWTAAGTTSTTFVTATPVVNGKPINVDGAAWIFNVNDGTVMGFAGSLAPLKSLGSYSLVPAASAVKRLNDPGFATSGLTAASATLQMSGAFTNYSATASGPGSKAWVNTGGSASATSSTLPKSPTPGSRIKWPITNVTITKARVELAQYVQPDGAVLVLPTYAMTGSDGNTYSVLALSDESLATASR